MSAYVFGHTFLIKKGPLVFGHTFLIKKGPDRLGLSCI